MIRRTLSNVAFVLGIALLVFASVNTTGCAPSQPAKAAITQAEKQAAALGWEAAKASRTFLNDLVEAEFVAESKRLEAELAKRNGTVREYEVAIAGWKKRTGWDAKRAAVMALGDSLRLLKSHMRTGDVSRADALKAADSAAAALAELSRLTSLPSEVADAITLARFGLPRLIR